MLFLNILIIPNLIFEYCFCFFFVFLEVSGTRCNQLYCQVWWTMSDGNIVSLVLLYLLIYSSSSIFKVNIITPTIRGDILRHVISVYITWVKCLAEKMCLQAKLKNWKGAGCTKVVRQCIRKLRGSSTESSCSQGRGNGFRNGSLSRLIHVQYARRSHGRLAHWVKTVDPQLKGWEFKTRSRCQSVKLMMKMNL